MHDSAAVVFLASFAARHAMRVTEAACRMAANFRSGKPPLQLGIVDGQGAVVIESVPIR